MKRKENDMKKLEDSDLGFYHTNRFGDNAINYDAANGVRFNVYYKGKKVTCVRANLRRSGFSDGMIGNFVGGKGRLRRFSFKTPEALAAKLEKLSLVTRYTEEDFINLTK